MPMGMTDIQPVATNTTLVRKKFPINENDNEKQNKILDEYEEILIYQKRQLQYIDTKTNINDLTKLYIIHNIYDDIDEQIFDLKQQILNNDISTKDFIQYRIKINTLFTKLLIQIDMYLKYINKSQKINVNINKKDIDQYDMLIPSDKKDWLINRNF